MGFISVLPQGEMTVFRAVETWLSARREEMAKEGEQSWLRMRACIWEYFRIQRSSWKLGTRVVEYISLRP